MLRSSEDRFGYEWEKFSEILPEYEFQFLKWVKPLKKSYFKNKLILDAGCGIGRNSFWPMKYGAKGVFAFDHDWRTVNVAKRNLACFSTAQVGFGTIYDIHKTDQFDFSHAIGVIQHLKKPNLAISQMVQATKPGGQVLIWVLGKEGNGWIIRIVTPIRSITSHLPLPVVEGISFIFTIPIYLSAHLLPSNHPYMKQISKYRFKHIHSIVFDHLIPEIINYWTKSEAENLLINAGLINVQAFSVNNNSWTVIGIKPNKKKII